MNTPSQIMSAIGLASLNGGLLIVLLFLLRPWLRRVSGSQWVHGSWAIVLLRLFFLPVGLAWGIAGILSEPAPTLERESPWKVQAHVEDSAEKSAADLESRAVVSEPRTIDRAWPLFVMWLAGTMGLAGYFAVGAWRTWSICRRAQPADANALLRMQEGLPEGMRKRIRVAITDEIPVAALAGIWNPLILLPRQWLAQLDDEELRHVILHELGHIRRGDLIGQWLMTAALCVHWFNPLVWLGARRMRMDAELACDAWVLSRVTEPEREAYGETLLRTSQLFRHPLRMLPAAIGMAASRDTLIARIRHVGRYCPKSRWREILGISAAAGVVAILGAARLVAQTPATLPDTAPPAAPPAPTTVEVTPQPETAKPGPPDQSAAQPKAKPRRAPMIEIESRFFEVSEPLAIEMGLIPPLKDGSPKAAGHAGVTVLTAGAPGMAVNSVLDTAALDKLLRTLNATKGMDLLSAPRVTTTSGQKAVIEIIREFRYPTAFEVDKDKGLFVPTEFETRNLGVTLTAEPTLSEEDQVIDLALAPEVVELEGFVRTKDSQPVPLATGRSVGANKSLIALSGVTFPKDSTLQPVFSTRKITTSVSMYSGSTILLGGLKREDKVDGKPPITRMLYILVTARIIAPVLGTPPPGAAKFSLPAAASAVMTSLPAEVAPPPPPLSAGADDDPIAVGTPVAGKPGFIVSPFEPKAGYVDVRGFPPGTAVKCPYTGKMFKIP